MSEERISRLQRIQELKEQLYNTQGEVIKTMEGYPTDDPDIMAKRQLWREQIATLEGMTDAEYEDYVEPEPTEYVKDVPSASDIVSQLKKLSLPLLEEMTDEEALEYAVCFPTWTSLLGQSVAADTRVWDNGYLWKVVQAHTFSTEWRPEVATSLFTKVQIQQEQGTIDNPIEYSINMELIQGKYYVENGILYLCIRPLSQSVWALSALVGNYVEVVNS